MLWVRHDQFSFLEFHLGILGMFFCLEFEWKKALTHVAALFQKIICQTLPLLKCKTLFSTRRIRDSIFQSEDHKNFILWPISPNQEANILSKLRRTERFLVPNEALTKSIKKGGRLNPQQLEYNERNSIVQNGKKVWFHQKYVVWKKFQKIP